MNFASVYSDTCWPFHSSIKSSSKPSQSRAAVEKGERGTTSCTAVKGEALGLTPALFSSVAT